MARSITWFLSLPKRTNSVHRRWKNYSTKSKINMREIINYMFEANIALLVFLIAYKVMLRNENNFRFMRVFLLLSILISVSFPLFEFNGNQPADVLSVGNVL